MTIEIIKSQINKFLSSKEPEVMAIKGSWGIGKTYSWKKFLKEAKDGQNIGLGMYSYISLFGINSLNEFKYSIFVNKIKRSEIGEDASIKSFTYNVNKTLNAVKEKSVKLSILDFISKAFSRNSVSNIAESIAFLSLSETIICIDDLERRSKGLELKDVLGLVSLLKEQKKCKVVLLLNDNNLSKEDLEDYTKYRDKVIDIELEFSPTSSENVAIAFQGTDYATEILKESAIKLDIKNIRVLTQTERLVNLVIPHLIDYEQEITHQVVHTLTLFAWCHYCHKSDNVPSLDYVIKTTNNFDYDLEFKEYSEDKNETEEEKSWKILINNYGYTATDKLDLFLSKVIQTGYVIEDELKEKAEEKNREIKAHKAGKSYRNAWDLFHNSFNDNRDEVVSSFYEKIKTNIKYINPNNLQESVWLFRNLGENNKAEEIIDFFIEVRKEEINLFDTDSFSGFGRDITDQSIRDKFTEIHKSSVTQETAEQVLDRISGKNGWNPKDTEVLSNTSIEKYYQLFKSINNRTRLSSFIRTCLRFGEVMNASIENKEIANRAIEALKNIAQENDLNKLRVRKYIKLDELPQNNESEE